MQKKWENQFKFDKVFFRELYGLLKPFWQSEQNTKAFLYFFACIVLTLINVKVSLSLNAFNKNFYDALAQFNQPALVSAIYQFLIIVTVMALTTGYQFYFSKILTLRWRQWLTESYLTNWLSRQHYRRWQVTKSNLDNPDQRLSNDLELFPASTLNLFFILFSSFLSFVAFSIVLWNLAGYLFWSALLLGCVGIYLTAWIGRKLSTLNVKAQQVNADFRFSLVQMREQSHRIAVQELESSMKEKLLGLFQPIYKNALMLAQQEKHLKLFSSFYCMIMYVAGIFLALPLYLHKTIQLGGLIQISGAFGTVIGIFTTVVSTYPSFTEWRAVIARLLQLNYFMQENNLSLKLSSRAVNDHFGFY